VTSADAPSRAADPGATGTSGVADASETARITGACTTLIADWRVVVVSSGHFVNTETDRVGRDQRSGATETEHPMGFGVGVFLILVGAILAFAVRDAWSFMDLTMVGYICIGVGVLALLLAFITMANRRRQL